MIFRADACGAGSSWSQPRTSMLSTAAIFYDPFEAEIVRARLQAEGIPATAAHYHHVLAYWPLGMALGGVRVQVPAVCLPEALEVLAAYHSGELRRSLETEAGLAAEACPDCGSQSFRSMAPWSRRVGLTACFLAFGMVFPLHASRRKCNACGAAWQSQG